MEAAIDDLETLYEYYSQDYTLEWGDDAHSYFCLYFTDNKSREYKLLVFEDFVELNRRSRILKWYWGQVTHLHFDFEDSTIKDVEEGGIKYLLSKYDDPTKHSVFNRLAQYGYEYSCEELHLGWKGKLIHSGQYDLEWSASNRDGIWVKMKRKDPWRVFFEYADGGCVIFGDEILGLKKGLCEIQGSLDTLRGEKHINTRGKFKKLERIIYDNISDWLVEKQQGVSVNVDIFHIVKKYVDRGDFYDLLKGGAPKDEYDSESERIASQISTGSSVEEIGNVISSVMGKAFATPADKTSVNDPNRYRDISEKIKKEMEESICTDEMVTYFLEEFPEHTEEYHRHIQEYGGLLGHVFYADVINVPLCDLFETGDNSQRIRKYCEFIEYMWKHGNDADRNVVDVTILEKLSDDKQTWQRLGTYFSDEFREYINNELLNENLMMVKVSKL